MGVLLLRVLALCSSSANQFARIDNYDLRKNEKNKGVLMYYKIKSHSAKGKLRKQIGALHLKILKLRRGNQCEICGKTAPNIGRFHILRTGRYPRLEFVDENVLLSCWYPCHFAWHHYGANDERNARTLETICKLRGYAKWKALEIDFLIRNEIMPKHTAHYLNQKLFEMRLLLGKLQEHDPRENDTGE